MRILLEEGRDFALQQAIGHTMGQNDLPHVDVLLVQSIIQFNALQLISSLSSLLKEAFPTTSLIDPS